MWDTEMQNAAGTLVLLLIVIAIAYWKQAKSEKRKNKYTEYTGR